MYPVQDLSTPPVLEQTANATTVDDDQNKTKMNQQTVLGVSRLARSSTAISIVDFFTRLLSPSTFCGLATSGEVLAGFAFLGTRVALTAYQPASASQCSSTFCHMSDSAVTFTNKNFNNKIIINLSW